MDRTTAEGDLELIRSLLERTQERIDPHAFHFVVWGALVLVCYPAVNLLGLAGNGAAAAGVGIAGLALGILLSTGLEWRLRGQSRLAGENSHIEGQVVRVVWGCLAPAILLSIEPLGFVPGESIALVWGFAYAAMAYMLGVVYRREFTVSGIAILLATLVAMHLPAYSGLILGPVMGIGFLVPGWMGERRVRHLREQAGAASAGEFD